MPKISVNILTKDRSELLKRALDSVFNQNCRDIEVIVINDASVDDTQAVLSKHENIKVLNHGISQGITTSRHEALMASAGEYVAVLDDDDEWIDPQKLSKQIKYLDEHPEVVLVGGGIKIANIKYQILKFRPTEDRDMRNTMLFRNNFFTSTVLFRKDAAIKAGGFIKDEIDLAEDYDLWLRMGKIGKMHNFREAFTLYNKPDYNKAKFRLFLKKQSRLITKHKQDYPFYFLAKLLLKFRLLIGF